MNLIVFILFMAVLLSAIFSMFSPSRTQKITDGLFAVNCGMVNFYALETSDGVALFDTGMLTVLAKRGLKKAGINPDAVTHIFLTHTDFDHMGGRRAFPDAAVYISKQEEQMINGQTARRGFIRNGRLATYKTLADGEVIAVGDRSIQARLAPGHTPGSTIYMVDGSALITGDLLRLSRGGGVSPFFRLMNMDHKRDIQSLKAAGGLISETEYVLTGHNGYVGSNTKKR